MQTILLPESPKVVKKEGNRTQIQIAGCSPGYGMTLGNALRRVLLSSLPGAAITAIKIKGVSHEFVAVPGVMEDVTILMLNLKQVRFRMHADGGSLRVTLSKKGKGEVRAGDIQTTSDLEVANPELHLATLTSGDAELEMELEVEKGLGYVPVEEHRREKVEVGLVALDALFSPIKRVNYEVENMRVGDRTDFNRIRFDIETDGTMTPEEAFRRAVDILVEQFGQLKELREADISDSAVLRSKNEVSRTQREEVVSEEPSGTEGGLAPLKLKTRVQNALEASQIRTVQDIVAKTEDELLAVEGLGEKAVKEIKKAIGKLGFTLVEKK